MKKLILITVLAVMCIALLPPALPSSFYGHTNLRIGQKIDVYVDGAKVASTRTFDYNGISVYTINVPGELSGKTAYFKVRNIILAEHILVSGTNVRVDLER